MPPNLGPTKSEPSKGGLLPLDAGVMAIPKVSNTDPPPFVESVKVTAAAPDAGSHSSKSEVVASRVEVVNPVPETSVKSAGPGLPDPPQSKSPELAAIEAVVIALAPVPGLV